MNIQCTGFILRVKGPGVEVVVVEKAAGAGRAQMSSNRKARGEVELRIWVVVREGLVFVAHNANAPLAALLHSPASSQ